MSKDVKDKKSCRNEIISKKIYPRQKTRNTESVINELLILTSVHKCHTCDIKKLKR